MTNLTKFYGHASLCLYFVLTSYTSLSPWIVHIEIAVSREEWRPVDPRSLGSLARHAGWSPAGGGGTAHIAACSRCPWDQCPAPPWSFSSVFNYCINRMLDTWCSNHVGKHVTSNIACACSQRYTTSVLQLAQIVRYDVTLSCFFSDQTSFQIVRQLGCWYVIYVRHVHCSISR